MADKFKTAFDSIKAEESLKSNTISFLQNEIQSRGKLKKQTQHLKWVSAFASIIIVLFAGVFSHQLYFTSDAYVDIDINPSVELAVNAFDRVIDVHAYNQDGEDIISALNLKHKNYQDAILLLMDEINRNGYIKNDGLISVTLQTTDENRENQMLLNIQTDVTSFMSTHHNTTQIDVFPVSDTTRAQAYELEVTPAKYLAIQELIEVDPSVTIEGCRRHSVSELKQLTNHHMNRMDDDQSSIDNNNSNSDNNAMPSNTGGHGGHSEHGGHGGKHHMGQ